MRNLKSVPEHDKKQPKVIITAKTFDSVTLSFDHFAPEDYTHGYVAIVRTKKHVVLRTTWTSLKDAWQ